MLSLNEVTAPAVTKKSVAKVPTKEGVKVSFTLIGECPNDDRSLAKLSLEQTELIKAQTSKMVTPLGKVETVRKLEYNGEGASKVFLANAGIELEENPPSDPPSQEEPAKPRLRRAGQKSE